MNRTTLGKSRVRESRTLGSVGAKLNGLATRPSPRVLFGRFLADMPTAYFPKPHRRTPLRWSPLEQATTDADAQCGGLDRLDAALDLDTRDGHAHRVADLRGPADQTHAAHLRRLLPFKSDRLEARPVSPLRHCPSSTNVHQRAMTPRICARWRSRSASCCS